MKTKLFFMLLIGILSVSCIPKEGPNCHLKAEIINESDRDIYVTFNFEDLNTSGPMVKDPRNNPTSTLVLANGGTNTQAIRFIRPQCLETYLYDTSMVVYIYDRELYDATPDDELKNLHYESYIFTLENFRSLDWKITYPKDMEGREYRE